MPALLLAVALSACAGRPAATRDPTPSISFERTARPVLRDIGFPASRDPSLAFDSGGRLWLGAVTGSGDDRGYRLFVSDSLGDRFRVDQTVPVGRGLLFDGQNGPAFVLDRSEFAHVLYASEAAGRHRIVAERKRWFESRWTEADVRDRAAPPATWAAFADVAVAPSGAEFVSMLDERNHRGPSDDVSEVWFARSGDGLHFAKNARIAAHTCSCCRTAVAAGDGNDVYVAFRGNYDTDRRDVALATSHDGGAAFDPPVRISNDGWSIHGCPESGPALLADRGIVRVAWFTLGADATPRILLSTSADGGKTFEPPVIVSSGVLDPNHPRLALAKPDGALLTFEGRDPSDGGFGKTRAWIVRISSRGVTAPEAVTPSSIDVSDPVALMPNATLVAVAATSPRGVVLVRGRVR